MQACARGALGKLGAAVALLFLAGVRTYSRREIFGAEYDTVRHYEHKAYNDKHEESARAGLLFHGRRVWHRKRRKRPQCGLLRLFVLCAMRARGGRAMIGVSQINREANSLGLCRCSVESESDRTLPRERGGVSCLAPAR